MLISELLKVLTLNNVDTIKINGSVYSLFVIKEQLSKEVITKLSIRTEFRDLEQKDIRIDFGSDEVNISEVIMQLPNVPMYVGIIVEISTKGGAL